MFGAFSPAHTHTHTPCRWCSFQGKRLACIECGGGHFHWIFLPLALISLFQFMLDYNQWCNSRVQCILLFFLQLISPNILRPQICSNFRFWLKQKDKTKTKAFHCFFLLVRADKNQTYDFCKKKQEIIQCSDSSGCFLFLWFINAKNMMISKDHERIHFMRPLCSRQIWSCEMEGRAWIIFLRIKVRKVWHVFSFCLQLWYP